MDRFARVVMGYHGAEPAFAEALLRGEADVSQWSPSENEYDWLGRGVYFWEHAPARAREWGARKSVIGAVIQLGVCLDLTEVTYTKMLADYFAELQERYQEQGTPMPENKGKRRTLDCLVINRFIEMVNVQRGIVFQTVRCPFLEGDPIFAGSAILSHSHIQIAVRDKNCILGTFRPHVTE